MNKKKSTKKEGKSKDKCSAEEVVAALQGHYTKEVWKQLLFLRENGFKWLELAYWTSLVKSEPWCLFEIRSKSITTPMLQLQYKPRGNGSRLLPKNAKGNRTRSNGKAPTRSKSKRKSDRSLSKTNN